MRGVMWDVIGGVEEVLGALGDERHHDAWVE